MDLGKGWIIVFVIICSLVFYQCGIATKIKLKTMKNINEEETIELKVGTKFTYNFSQHGSVGIDAEYGIEDETIVEYQTTKNRYHHPLKMMRGMSGGDAATGTFIFKAIKAGKTTIKFQRVFRGSVESETVKTIIVL